MPISTTPPPPGVGDVGDSRDDWILGTVAPLGGWGGGFGGGGGGLGGVFALRGWGGFCLGCGLVGFWCHPVGWRRHFSPRMTQNKTSCWSSWGGGGWGFGFAGGFGWGGGLGTGLVVAGGGVSPWTLWWTPPLFFFWPPLTLSRPQVPMLPPINPTSDIWA